MDQFDDALIGVRNKPHRTTRAKVGGFLWHLLQMVLAMEAGMMVYHLLLGTLFAGSGFAILTKENRLFGYWMMVVPMALAMLAFMRFRRYDWRHCSEMTLAMLAPLAGLTVLVLCYVFPVQTLRSFGDPLMILAMAAYMLVRSGHHAHGQEQACH